jgi:signal transduction histidine kinase
MAASTALATTVAVESFIYEYFDAWEGRMRTAKRRGVRFETTSGGMGIGLFVSRSIIERHHGRLWVEPNKSSPGTTFSFSIPCGGEAGSDTVPVTGAA